MPTRRRLRDWLSRDHLYISVPALILVMGAFVVAWSFMKPAPPRRLAMASGPPDGIYYQMGLRYRALLAREGITLDVDHVRFGRERGPARGCGQRRGCRLCPGGRVDDPAVIRPPRPRHSLSRALLGVHTCRGSRH